MARWRLPDHCQDRGGRTVGYALLEEPPRDWFPTDDEPERLAYLAEVVVDEAIEEVASALRWFPSTIRAVLDSVDLDAAAGSARASERRHDSVAVQRP